MKMKKYKVIIVLLTLAGACVFAVDAKKEDPEIGTMTVTGRGSLKRKAQHHLGDRVMLCRLTEAPRLYLIKDWVNLVM
jgi:hypothetical protein